MKEEFIRLRAEGVKVGDTVQHPVFPARWLTIEWVGVNHCNHEVSLAGRFEASIDKTEQREAWRFKMRDTVIKAVPTTTELENHS